MYSQMVDLKYKNIYMKKKTFEDGTGKQSTADFFFFFFPQLKIRFAFIT